MLAGVLNKPKQGTRYQVSRGELMNVPELYDDEKERLKTDLVLLYNANETLYDNQPLQGIKSEIQDSQPSQEGVMQITDWQQGSKAASE